MNGPLLLPEGPLGLLRGGERETLGTGGLQPEVLGLVLLAVVESAEVGLLGLADDSQDTSDGLAHSVAKRIL